MKQLNWYQIFGKSNIPDGRTVLPTDDIQIWLNCANIWDKTYTTLAEVLADTTTLLALINSPNAVDYMVRSTTWAVAQALVPIMTSDTTPSGVCSCSHEGAQPWYAFDGDDSTRMTLRPSSINYEWVGYEFETPQSVRKIKDLVYGTINTRVSSAKLQYSLDGNTWNDIQTFSDYKNSSSHEYAISTSQIAKYWRIYVSFNASDFIGYFTIQFYGESITNNSTAMSYIGLNNYCANTLLADSTWCEAICNSEYFESVLNVKVPVMTSNTTPSGECFGSTPYSGKYWYFAFNGNSYSSNAKDKTSALSIGYKFERVVGVKYVTADMGTSDSATHNVTFDIQGSNDNIIWESLLNTQIVATFNNATFKLKSVLERSGDYRYYRIVRVSSTVADRLMANNVQFYGRQDV